MSVGNESGREDISKHWGYRESALRGLQPRYSASQVTAQGVSGVFKTLFMCLKHHSRLAL